MLSKKHIYYALGGLLVAAIWGYFSDLKNEDVYSFVGRLVFIPLFIIALDTLFWEKRKDSDK